MSNYNDRHTCWSVTINNPTPDDDECIALVRQRGWKVEGQEELGLEGTAHYQLMIKTPQMRFGAMKKAFPRAHIEAARNAVALAQYVVKQDTRVSSLSVQSDMYPSLSKFWHLIYDYFADEIVEGPAEEYYGFNKPIQLMEDFDMAVSDIITRGYNVETIAANPQTRYCFKNYACALFVRVYLEKSKQNGSNKEANNQETRSTTSS